MTQKTAQKIEKMIYIIRDQKVMLDSDLAELYGVETSALNRQVRRNLSRFPADFMFELTKSEFDSLICQNGISKIGRGGRTKLPLVFTELGIAMLSSVLKSEAATQVNISIMRIFVRLRSYYALEEKIEEKIDNIQKNVSQVFKVVFERLDRIENNIPLLPNDRKKIGIKN